jgi:hypothetical protein
MLLWPKETSGVSKYEFRDKMSNGAYGAECWVLTKKDELQLAVFEREVLRKIFSPIKDTDQWRRRYNVELYQLYAEPDIVKWIRSARLRWLDI